VSGASFLIALAAGCVALSGIMAAAWVVQQRSGNSGWVDTIWTFGVGLIGLAAVYSADVAHGRSWLLGGLIALWMLRLGLHIAQRTSAITDDPRYADLVRGWGADAPRQMFVLLQKQALVSIPLVATLILAAHNTAEFPRLLDLAAAAIVLIGATGEALADAQLRRFRSLPANRGRVCDVGLWGWSRHPNYFFEWLMWVGFALLAIDAGSALSWLALSGPATIYWLLTRVSGIPPLEEHMLRTRGDDYRAYQRRTRAFFPLPRLGSP
jgi:steroid 5-alpha reductase family enzyme